MNADANPKATNADQLLEFKATCMHLQTHMHTNTHTHTDATQTHAQRICAENVANTAACAHSAQTPTRTNAEQNTNKNQPQINLEQTKTARMQFRDCVKLTVTGANNVLSCHVQNSIAVDFKSHFSLRLATSRWDPTELKLAQQMMVLCHPALSLDHLDVDSKLMQPVCTQGKQVATIVPSESSSAQFRCHGRLHGCCNLFAHRANKSQQSCL